ncbi:chromo domain-containing protein LHP1 [Prosopis cineraria]|uniref:chromo domain-containing protein LHP1 n=1 Tax=Prosopis cineraria TaxID=364024 RepID=UPI0024105B48|nr:chromo domain-containing protein LHP1 [Prosopis cineraria]
MKGGRINLEAPNDSATFSAAADVLAVAPNNGGDDPLTPSVVNDQTQFHILEGDEAQGQVSEEAEADEEDEEVGDQVSQEVVRPKLDEGYFEIEAIRRRRVRKGQLEYLIKWRDWPETANTWEPPENLQSVPDVVEAFEVSLRSGKHRKRKRKHAVHHTLPKKRQHRSTTSYSLRQFSAKSVADNHCQSAPTNDPSLTDLPAHPQPVIFADEVEENGNGGSFGNAGPADENWGLNVSKLRVERESDYDPKLTELKATSSFMTANGINSNKLAIHIQEANASIGNAQMNGQSKVDCMGLNQGGRCRGAKRRKSGSVKRFKKDSDDTQNQAIIVEQAWSEITGFGGNNSHKMGDAKTSCNIVKIIKPLSYSASVSSEIPDIIVNFLAMRSDGTEVEVDNKYLKADNPLLLINFYEQRLRFNPAF